MSNAFILFWSAVIVLFLWLLPSPAHGVDGCPVEPCISATSWSATPTPEMAPPPLAPVAYVYLPLVR